MLFGPAQWKEPEPKHTALELLLGEGKIAITGRDLDILEALMQYRFLTTSQIMSLFFREGSSAERRTRERMKELFDHGLVRRFRPRMPLGAGTHPMIWALTHLGYEALHMAREFDEDEDLPWREDAYALEESRVLHDIGLNEYCISVELEADQRGINDFDWLPTRLAWQQVTGRPGQDGFRIAPDAMLFYGGHVVHLEFERYANPTRFANKIQRWKAYRKLAAWKDRYLRQPTILVVGFKEDGATEGRAARRIHSIEPLIEIAAKESMTSIFFHYVEDWRKTPRDWTVVNPRGEKTTVWELKERLSFGFDTPRG